jgi:hypothetical protein
MATKVTVKVHNSLDNTASITINHKKDISPILHSDDPILLIFSGVTVERHFEIDDGKHGELHLSFKSSHGILGTSTREEGTFKCDNLKSPSKDNAIGNPPDNIEVTEAKYNSEHTESEIHIYVGGKKG